MCFILACVIVLSIKLLPAATPGEAKLILLITFFFIVVLLYPTIKKIKFMAYVKINEDEIESFLFRKSLCKVDRRKTVYYAFFYGSEALTSTMKYIAISNSPFECYDLPPFKFFTFRFPKNFLDTYDIKNQIVVPYHEETISVLQIDGWINVRDCDLK